MQKEPKIAVYESGALHFLADESSSREVVVALPLSRLLLKMVRVPALEDPIAFATPLVTALSPFPDEPLLVSCETVRETPDARLVLAAALPEGATDDLANALDAAKLSVVKIDALFLGALRMVWNDLTPAGEGALDARRLVVLTTGTDRVLVVLDGDEPVSIHALTPEADIAREKALALLEAEDFNGAKDLAATVEREVSVDEALQGIRERALETESLDVLPKSWRQVLAETRFKAKLVRHLAVAAGIWVLAMGVLFGVPIAYDFCTDHVKGLSRRHQAQYKAVADKKAKTMLVRKYSDFSRGALEMMKAVSDRLEGDITLSGFEFTREKGVRVKGEATDKGSIYKFKDNLAEMATEGGEAVFTHVVLGSVHSQKDGTQRFDLECNNEEDE